MSQKLCVVEGIHAVRADGQVAIFKMLGDDYWGCRFDELLNCAGIDEPVIARNLASGMKVWIDVEACTTDGRFFSHCVVDGISQNN
jgi:hypothetical protein